MKILVIEDQVEDAIVIEKILERDAPADDPPEVTRVGTLAKAVDAVQKQRFDCVLLDLGLPDGRGLNNLRRLRSVKPTMAIVILSGISDEQTAVAAMRAGAQAYVVKQDLASSENIYEIARVAMGAHADHDHRELATHRGLGRFELDSQHQIISWDQQCELLLKWAADDVVGKPFLDLVPAGRREEISAALGQAESKFRDGVKLKMLRADGRTRLVDIVPDPAASTEGHACWRLSDGEAARRAHQAMQVLDLILTATSDAVINMDLEGSIHSCSDATSALLGQAEGALIGAAFHSLFPDDEQHTADAILAAIRKGRTIRDLDADWVNAELEPLRVRLTLAPLRDEYGSLIGACALAYRKTEADDQASDRSERMLLEERLSELREEFSALQDAYRTLRRSGDTS